MRKWRCSKEKKWIERRKWKYLKRKEQVADLKNVLHASLQRTESLDLKKRGEERSKITVATDCLPCKEGNEINQILPRSTVSMNDKREWKIETEQHQLVFANILTPLRLAIVGPTPPPQLSSLMLLEIYSLPLLWVLIRLINISDFVNKVLDLRELYCDYKTFKLQKKKKN